MEVVESAQGSEMDGNSSLEGRKSSGATPGTSPAFHQIGQELRDTIQFLAIQNMHLSKGKRDAENKLTQVNLAIKSKCASAENESLILNAIRNYAMKHKVEILVSGKVVGIDSLLEQASPPNFRERIQMHTGSQTERSIGEPKLRCSAVDEMKPNQSDITGASSSNKENRVVEYNCKKSADHGGEEGGEGVEGEIGIGVEDRESRNRLEMENFKEDLKNKREERHKVISARSSEMERLRGELQKEKLAKKLVLRELESVRSRCHEVGKDNAQELLMQEINQLKNELSTADSKNVEISSESKSLKEKIESLSNLLKGENLKYDQDMEFAKRRIEALKDVAALSKQMLTIRENQVSDLKERLRLINQTPRENSVGAQSKIDMDSQQNEIIALKSKHEEHLQKINEEKEHVTKKLEEKTNELLEHEKKYIDLKNQFDELHITASEAEELNKSLRTRLDLSVDESKGLSKEISLINSTFTQMLIGNSSTAVDLDKLTRILQENHDLITEMTTNEESSETAACLPKLLLDLVNQIDSTEHPQSTSDLKQPAKDAGTAASEQTLEHTLEQCEADEKKILHVNPTAPDQYQVIQEDGSNNNLAVEEIASNLPKVWRVLMELLSHHTVPSPTSSDKSKSSCYKSIDTPSGPKLVPSVSNTYIRLKDLILEKKSLQKDLGKLKQLNGHLESKLHEQETRLSLVSAELQKTWGVVGRLRSQFRQLRTHEQILRYELQQKRNLLTELKTELEYCREKWEKARQKDLETAEECKKLRKEFAARKLQDQNNSSSESGFSDGKDTENVDDDKYVSKHLVACSSSEKQQTQPGKQEARNSHETAVSKTKNEDKEESSASLTAIRSCNASDVPYPRPATTPCNTKMIWMSLLKLHFMFSPRNRTCKFEHNHSDDMKSLESIFSLQPIIIPELILQQLKDENGGSVVASEELSVESVESVAPDNDSESNACNAAGPSMAGSSGQSDGKSRDALGRTPEEALAARAARLQRLEEQTQMLFKKVTRTTNRSAALCTRLEELHEQYGVPNPPPLPQVLPVLRIPVFEDPEQNSSMPSTSHPEPSTNDLSTLDNDIDALQSLVEC